MGATRGGRAEVDSTLGVVTEVVAAGLPLAESALWLLHQVCDQRRLDRVFAEYRGRGYQKVLTFPVMVDLIGDSLLQQGGRGYRAFTRAQEEGVVTTSLVAIYGKLGRLNLDLSMAFLAEGTDPLRALFPKAARRALPKSLARFQSIILDGKAIKRVAKRLKPLRGVAGGLLGGRTLVALEFATGLVVAMHAEEDGDANDSRFVPRLLPVVRERISGTRLWLCDSGFCDLQRMKDFTEHGDHFLLRFHPKNGFHSDRSCPVRKGRDAQGRRFEEEWGWLGAENHKLRRYVRRMTLHRKGEKDVILVTDLLSADQYPATDLLDHYLERWGIERVFQQVTETFGLQGLIGSTPRATVFQFSFCLVLYNVLQTIRGFVALHQHRQTESISIEKVYGDVRDELTAWSVLAQRGIVNATHFEPPSFDEPRTVEATAQRLHEILRDEWSDRWLKFVNKKHRPAANLPTKRTHSSVYRLLNPTP